MVLRIATREYFESLERFLEHLPPTLDSNLLVLKGHLLVERLLEKYLQQNVPHPERLEIAQFSFAEKLRIVAALHQGAESEWLWKAIRLLNTLRNDLAHKLENSRKDPLLRAFLHTVENSPVLPKLEPPREITERLHRAIFSVHEAMSRKVNL